MPLTDTVTESAEAVTGPFGHDYGVLARALAPLHGRRVVFVPNPGNAGDALIAVGTFRFLRHIGFEIEMGDIAETYPDTHLLYSGGGNLIEIYPNARKFFRRHKDICASLTLLPHTVRGHEDLLAELDGRFTLFAREAPTLVHLQAHAKRANVAFCHDMAFFSDLGELRREVPPSLEDARYHLLWQAQVARRRVLGKGTKPRGGGVLNAFRTDKESTGIALPEGNVDLSAYYAARSHSPYMAAQIVLALMRAIEPFATVRTNRLHIAVLSAMMGKSVEVSDNSYGKLRDICDASLTDFDNIRFF